jgi:hypothetical protein
MKVPKYEIFFGHNYENAVWLEVVEGLGCAVERMKERATKTPGPYFVFCAQSHAVLLYIDTTSIETIAQRHSAS